MDRLNTYKALILDFDGVVIESNEIKTLAFEQVFSLFPEYAYEMMQYHHLNVSQSRYNKFSHLLSLLGKEDDGKLKMELADKFSNIVQKLMMDVPLVNGAENFLRSTTLRLPVYLASITPQKELELILKEKGLLHWFVGVYGCPPWPKEIAINEIILRENVLPTEALLIGDSAGDQRAAQSTGIHFIGRNSGLIFDEPLPIQFKDMSEILKYLNN